MQKANVEYGSGINPISRLIQIQQANKRKEPVYTLVMEHGAPRRREFIIQVGIYCSVLLTYFTVAGNLRYLDDIVVLQLNVFL